jgi:hypothetical protein
MPRIPSFDRQRRPSSACRHLLPASGEKNAFIRRFRQSATLPDNVVVATAVLLPVYGKKCPPFD